MHQFVHAHEIHVQAAQERRLREALEAEQRKLANARPRVGIIRPVRVALGAMLIAIGERIAQEAAKPTETPTVTRRVATA